MMGLSTNPLADRLKIFQTINPTVFNDSSGLPLTADSTKVRHGRKCGRKRGRSCPFVHLAIQIMPSPAHEAEMISASPCQS